MYPEFLPNLYPMQQEFLLIVDDTPFYNSITYSTCYGKTTQSSQFST